MEQVGISGLRDMVEEMDKNVVGKATWDKYGGGMKELFNQVIGMMWGRGFIEVADESSLGMIRGEDSQWCMVRGVGLYRYNYSVEGKTIYDVVASGGGLWVKVFGVVSVPYSQVVSSISSGVVVSVGHGLGELFPVVRVYQEKVGGGYSLMVGYAVDVVDSNNLNITWADGVADRAVTIVISK